MSLDRQRIVEAAQKFAARDQFDKAIVEYQKILRDDPNDVRILLKVGDLQVRINARQAAIETYTRVAQTYDQQGFFLKAVAVFKQILQIDPGRVDLYGRLADLYVKLGLVSDALQQLEALAQRYARPEEATQLLNVYKRMLQLDANNIATHIRLGELYSRLGRGDEAAEEFTAGCTLLEKASRMEDWAKVAERLFFHRQRDVGVARRLAAFYLERDDAKRALPKLQVAYKADSRNIETLDLLASAFRALGQLPKTISVLKEMARLQGEAGKIRERNDLYQRVLEVAPTDAEARDALKAQVKAPARRTDAPRSEPADVQVDTDGEEEVVFDVKPTVPPAADTSATVSRPSTSNQSSARPTPRPGPPAGAQRPFAPPPNANSQAGVIAPQGSGQSEAMRLVGEAEIFLKYGLRNKVAETLQRASQMDPDSVELHRRLRDLYGAMNELPGVVQECFTLANLLSEADPIAAISELDRVLEIDPSNAGARQLKAFLRGAVSSFPPEEILLDEVSVVDEAVVEEEVEEEPDGPTDVNDRDDLVIESYARTRFEPMVEESTEMGMSPLSSEGDDLDDAIAIEPEEVIESMSGPPGRREIEEGLDEAEFFVTQGLYDDAMDTLQQLLEIYPNHPLVLERWAEIHQLVSVQGAQLTGGFAIAQKLEEEVDNLALLETASDGQFDVAMYQQYGGAQGSDTVSAEDCDTHYDLGIAYKEMGLLDDAIAEFKIATMSLARQCIGDTMIGLCYMERAEVPLAIEHFRRGLQAPQKTEHEELGLYFELGTAYELLGDGSEALYYFQKVEKHDATFRNVREKVRALMQSQPARGAHAGSPDIKDVDLAFDELVKE